MELGLLQALSAGGDLATIALVVILWKLDRRVLVLELWRRGGGGKMSGVVADE